MAGKKNSSAKQSQRYKDYKSQEIWKANRTRRLQRHMRKFPDDLQAKSAKVVYRRNKFKDEKQPEKLAKLPKYENMHTPSSIREQLEEIGFTNVRRKRFSKKVQ